jgi:hypothetical protein
MQPNLWIDYDGAYPCDFMSQPGLAKALERWKGYSFLQSL